MATLASRFSAAQAAHREGRFDEAAAAYAECLAEAPGDPDVLHFQALLKYQSGEHAIAIDGVRASLAIAPANPHAWNNLGNMLAPDSPEEAIAAYVRATELAPGLVQAWFNLGVLNRRLRRIEQSVICYCKAVELEPADPAVYERFGFLLYALGRFDEAARVYRLWLARHPDSPVARHMLAAMTGEEVPGRAADSYVTSLFDSFSSSFDEQLRALEYRAPELLAAAMLGELPAGARVDVLDAGCGTGLCGPLLQSIAASLTGVDLSAGMVAKARERGVYDALHVQELTAFMNAHPQGFDVIVSADTLVYFGALDEVLAAGAGCLRPGGLLAFTLERGDAEGPPFRIQPHGRYTHHPSYARKLLAALGMSLLEQREVVLRKEKLADVAGLLVVAQRPSLGASR